MKKQYHFALLALAFVVAAMLNSAAIAQAPPGSLWYNGDFNGINGLANEQATSIGQSSVYDNFRNSAPWHITSVFSDNLENTTVTAATWEIRSGTPAGFTGTGGTLVASGATATPAVTPTGRSGFGFTEFMIAATGLNVNLPVLPIGQFYWLNVTPTGNGTGRSFDSQTSGAGAVGTPPGNDMNAFINSAQFGAVFRPTGEAPFSQPNDFSMGVIGNVVPEPASATLLMCGAGALLAGRRRRAA